MEGRSLETPREVLDREVEQQGLESVSKREATISQPRKPQGRSDRGPWKRPGKVKPTRPDPTGKANDPKTRFFMRYRS
jgi:hypothetical protein